MIGKNSHQLVLHQQGLQDHLLDLGQESFPVGHQVLLGPKHQRKNKTSFLFKHMKLK